MMSNSGKAIYGGHISGRRLRGIKINPIYHENDAANLHNATGQGNDGQFPPESVEPVGEIQFEVYESIPVPASRLRRQHRYHHHDPDSYDSEEDEEWQYGVEQVTGDTTGQSSIQQVSSRKQYLRRQERMDAVSSLDEEAPDVLDPSLDQFTPGTSGYSSPATSSRPSPKADRAGSSKNSSNPSDHYTAIPLHRQRQLTAVQEQNTLAEEEEEEEVQEDSGNLSSEDVYDEGVSSDNIGLGKSSRNTATGLEIGEETCHIVTFTDGKSGKNDELFASQESNKNIINNFISYRREISIEKDITSSFSVDENTDNSALLSREDKSVRCLDKLAMLPLYSNIHNTSPVTSVDYINNNYGAVPDRMLKHNGPLKEVDQYFEFLHTRSLSESDEDSKMNTANSDLTQHVDSEEFKIKKPSNCLKAVNSAALKEKCDCNGRPTLKCACGRAALQKLLYDKRMVKRYDMGTPLDCSIVEWSPEENNNDNKNVCKVDEEKENVKPVVPTCIKLKSILTCRHETADRSVSKHINSKTVTFHEDTIFNEGKKSTYVKECITPGFLCALIDSIEEGGFDNPVFEDDENDIKETTFSVENEKGQSSLTDDEKLQKKCSNKDLSVKNRISSPSPLALKVEDLNACSYMQKYLKGVQRQGCDVIRHVASCESSPSNSKLQRAPPVSIEAIAGTIVSDPTFDEIKEADEDQFEYYRRRQRRKHLSRYGGEDVGVDEWLKKTKRIKRIKISLIVAAIITVIVVAIALIVHFVGTPGSSDTDATDSVVFDDELDRDISRFSAGVLFRRR